MNKDVNISGFFKSNFITLSWNINSPTAMLLKQLTNSVA